MVFLVCLYLLFHVNLHWWFFFMNLSSSCPKRTRLCYASMNLNSLKKRFGKQNQSNVSRRVPESQHNNTKTLSGANSQGPNLTTSEDTFSEWHQESTLNWWSITKLLNSPWCQEQKPPTKEVPRICWPRTCGSLVKSRSWAVPPNRKNPFCDAWKQPVSSGPMIAKNWSGFFFSRVALCVSEELVEFNYFGSQPKKKQTERYQRYPRERPDLNLNMVVGHSSVRSRRARTPGRKQNTWEIDSAIGLIERRRRRRSAANKVGWLEIGEQSKNE